MSDIIKAHATDLREGEEVDIEEILDDLTDHLGIETGSPAADLLNATADAFIERELVTGKIMVALGEITKERDKLAKFKAFVHGAAARDVLAERQRQMDKEGWTTAHDDEHDTGQMARAAGCYAICASDHDYLTGRQMMVDKGVPGSWPWDAKWWKPTDRRRDLVKAGALIIAEIERLDRKRPPAADAKEGGK